MDETRCWDRIAEATRTLAAHHGVEVPEPLERVSGDYWSRNLMRRLALNDFLLQLPGTELFETTVPLDQVADAMDAMALSVKEASVEEKPSRRRKVQDLPAVEEAPEGNS